ncbi:MAG TPA: hypothetical protein VMT38_03985 [Terracidiphilus sp.]|nr:hypothetical protein [Terracidiphilus sp.]
MRKAVGAVLFSAVLCVALCPLLAAQPALNNVSIIKMVKAQLSDDVILATINASPGAYDTSADALIALKQAGVSNKVIDAIVAKSTSSASSPAAPAAAPASPAAPDSAAPSAPGAATPDASAPSAPPAAVPPPAGTDNVGVYYKDSGGNWQPLPSEVVIFQSGGLVKHVASAGLMKEDLNGLVGGMRSRLVVSTPVTLILHVPQGRTASDYELVRLHVSGNNRQFQSAVGGLNGTSGSIRDEVDFTSTQIAPSVYQIVLNNELGEGEFGFLEPQDSGASKTPSSSGKIFTFAVVE